MKAQLMLTCLCDAFYGEAAIATVQVLEHCGVEVIFPKDQTCCGQPAFNSGDWEAARALSNRVWEIFDLSFPIVVPSASCAAMLRHGSELISSGERSGESVGSTRHDSMENPNPLTPSPCSQGEGEDWSAPILGAKGLRTLSTRAIEPEPTQTNPNKPEQKVFELSEFLLDILQITEWPLHGRVIERKRTIIFHQSCHGRMIGLGDKQKELLRLVSGLEILEPEFPEQCCGFGGMFSVKQPHLSESIGLQKLSSFREMGNYEIVSGDMGCLMHLQTLATAQNEPLTVKHYAQVLTEAIGE